MTSFTVRLEPLASDTATLPKMVTAEASRLRWKKILRGGDSSVNFNLKRSIDAEELASFGTATVYCAETGQEVCSGRLLNPGKALSASGEEWEVSALGHGLAILQDQQRPYVLMDQLDEKWYQAFKNTEKATWAQGEKPNSSVDGILLTTTDTVKAGKRSDLRYYEMREAEMTVPGSVDRTTIAAVGWTVEGGRTSTGNRFIVYASDFDSGSFIVINGTLPSAEVPPGSDANRNSAGNTMTATIPALTNNRYIGVHWTLADDIDNIFLRYYRTTTADLVATDADWFHVRDIRVQAVRLDRNGNPYITQADYDTWQLTLEQIVVDCLVRFCPDIDATTAEVFTIGLPFEQVAWPEGVTPYQVMDELLAAASGTWGATWEVFGKNYDTGKYPFTMRQLPDSSDVRYVVSNPLDYRRTGNDDEAYNEFWVSSTNKQGRTIMTRQAFVTPELTELGLTRSTTLAKGDESISASEIAAAAWLDARYSANAATVTLGAEILDTYTGRWIEPWEVECGYNMRLQGVSTKADALNTEATRGAAVFRTISVDYDADSGVAEVELNAVTFDEQQALASLLQFQTR